MMPGLSRALVPLAAACLGRHHQDWALAMAAELDVAIADGRSLSFASGCVLAALRQMPGHAEGRLKLASHALALGLIVPVAFLQFACAIGLSSGQVGLYDILDVVDAHDQLLGKAQLGAVPAMLILWLLLSIGHLQLAWTLLDRDWEGVARTAAFISAATLTLSVFVVLLLFDAATLRPLAGVLAVELLSLLGIAYWHARISPVSRPVQQAW